MKKILSLLSLTLLSLVSQSQSLNSFIEVIESDNSLVEPDRFYYTVTFKNTISSFSEYPLLKKKKEVAPLNEEPQAVRSLNLVRTVLKKLQIDTLAYKDYTAGNSNPYYNDGTDFPGNTTITAILNSRQELQNFVDEIRKIETVSGFVSKAESSKTPDAELTLYQQLIEKARKKASVLAGYAGRSIGRILEITEQEADDKSGWTMYPPLTDYIKMRAGISDNKIIIIKKIVVRFELLY